MRSSEAGFEFPLLGISSDKDLWGFPDARRLGVCGPRTLLDDMQVGMELVEPSGRRWVVRSVRRLGRAGGLVSWMVSSLLTAKPQSRIEQELDALPSVSLEEVQDRVCEAMEAHPEFWCEPAEFETVLRQRVAQVRATTQIRQIHEVLGLDTFEAY